MLRSLLSLIVFLLLISPAWSSELTKPNILFIMVDDLGKEWVSCYGAEDIKTPSIDGLAAAGMKFNNAWCMPQCTPTRVTLLTGQYPFRHGWTNHWDVPRW
ncbi:MAG: sulfatase-like hydrolase/transferase, partial [Planctomycetaceae bacterium]|nr:sulfatase-like hydrolase/transferase [Planctomycetaceae bacterium]